MRLNRQIQELSTHYTITGTECTQVTEPKPTTQDTGDVIYYHRHAVYNIVNIYDILYNTIDAESVLVGKTVRLK